MPADVESMVSVRETPWHGLGVIVEDCLNSEEVIEKAGLDWEVAKHQVHTLVNGVYVPVPDQFAIVRSDTQKPLPGVTVGPRYKEVQNKEAAEIMDAIIGTKEAVFETAGSLAGGKKIWLLAKIKGLLRIEGTDDTVEKYLLFSSAHDGTRSNEIALTTHRPVCSNTLELALRQARSARQVFRMRHSANFKDKVIEAKEELKLVNEMYADFNEQINAMAKKRMNSKSVAAFIKSIGIDREESKQTEKVADTLEDLFVYGKGNSMKGVKGSLWAMVNAVTEYADHFKNTRVTRGMNSKQESRLNSAWFGQGRELKNKAMKEAVQLVAA